MIHNDGNMKRFWLNRRKRMFLCTIQLDQIILNASGCLRLGGDGRSRLTNTFLGVFLQLLPQVLPVVHHQLLNGEERFVSHVGIVVAEQLHHQLLSVQLFDDAGIKNLVET